MYQTDTPRRLDNPAVFRLLKYRLLAFLAGGCARLLFRRHGMLVAPWYLRNAKGVAMADAKVTTDHQEIQAWVEERGGFPARVKGTDDEGEGGLLRIDYPGYSGGDRLEKISWEEFFAAFDENNLAFLYQEQLESGKTSRFSKLIDRESKEAKAA
jgi:hypothetical protein